MRIAVVEDLEEDRITLSRMIAQYLKEKSLCANLKQFERGEDLLLELEEKSYDIFFLDIFLGQANGMDIAEQIRKRDQGCLIIFVTTSKEYAIRGYQVRAFHYIVKPIDEESVNSVMSLCEQTLLRRAKFIELNDGGEHMCVFLNDIISVKKEHHYISLNVGETLARCRMSLTAFTSRLDDRFVACSRREIVNMDYVEKISLESLYLKNGQTVQITGQHYNRVQNEYYNYLLCKEWKDI